MSNSVTSAPSLPFSSANSRPLCSPEVILTVLHVLNNCTFYYDSRHYCSYTVRCPSSHYWLYATLISSLMMMMMMMMGEVFQIFISCALTIRWFPTTVAQDWSLRVTECITYLDWSPDEFELTRAELRQNPADLVLHSTAAARQSHWNWTSADYVSRRVWLSSHWSCHRTRQSAVYVFQYHDLHVLI